jgi:hypothetical protein
MVHHVIAVGAAGSGLQHRREIDVRDAQRGEIRHLRGGVGKGEAAAQLQPVGRGRSVQ